MPSLKDPGYIPRAPLGSQTSDKQYNQLVDHVAEITRTLSGSNGSAPGERPVIREVFLGQTTSTPPSGESAFSASDARYWVQRSIPLTIIAPTDAFGVQLDDFGRLNDPIVPAVNLAELPAQTDTKTPSGGGTHLLADNTVVLVIALSTRSSPLKKFYVFSQGGVSDIGSGQYQYAIYQMVSQNAKGWDFVRAHSLIG